MVFLDLDEVLADLDLVDLEDDFLEFDLLVFLAAEDLPDLLVFLEVFFFFGVIETLSSLAGSALVEGSFTRASFTSSSLFLSFGLLSAITSPNLMN